MQALATKYRPLTFEEVVGQENIIKILGNQIRNETIKQSYLFTGGAGTGKTTSARIFANSLDADLLEIDGASNNGVDNIRELREKAKFKPLNKKYKAIIIDEVHMLSTGAFNALLKILEEPPAHVIFIFATTDPQKIPATIISRVQRFDFKRLTVQQIQYRLMDIIEFENNEIEHNSAGEADSEDYIKVSKDALEYISKIANGGMRNAISVLDTCLGYQNTLEIEDIFNILGTTDYEAIFKVSSAICQNDYALVLNTVEELHQEGKDLKQFVKAFTEFTVDLMKFHLLSDFSTVSMPTIYKKQTEELLEQMKDGNENMREWFKKLSDLQVKIKYESNPKAIIQGELVCI